MTATLPQVLAVFIIALPLAGLLPGRPGRLLASGLLAALALAATAGLALPPAVWLPLTLDLAGHANAVALGIRADTLGLAMTACIAAIGLVVYRYAARYLLGDPRRDGFLAALAAVVAAAAAQALSPGLVQFALGWVLASLGLHRLLGHERSRPAAARAAAAKFLTSRLGDTGMAVAIAALLLGPGTTDFAALGTAAAGSGQGWLLLAGGAVVWGILCKTALMPAQHWLIATVEAPTPLSALMHAGVVNAGGFLAIRLSPLFAAAPGALDLLLAVGLVSAVAAPLVMWAQTDLKRSLAWSTVGQMGFMAVQCGLGAYGAAFLHLVGHGCYKAEAFLRSGTLARAVEERPQPGPLVPALARWLLGVALAAVVLAATYQLCGVDPRLMPGGPALLAVQALAMGQLLATPVPGRVGNGLRLALLVAGSALYALLTTGVEHLLVAAITPAPTARGAIGSGLILLAPLALAALGVLWVALPSIARHPAVIAWRVHAGNAFYLPHLTDRLLLSIRRRRATIPTERSS